MAEPEAKPIRKDPPKLPRGNLSGLGSLLVLGLVLSNHPTSAFPRPLRESAHKLGNGLTSDPFHQSPVAFQQPPQFSTAAVRIPRGGNLSSSSSSSTTALSSQITGMAEPILKLVSSSLVGDVFAGGLSGITSVLGLAAVAWSVVLPLTLYKKIYGIGVAYGFSVAAAGGALLGILPAAAGSPPALLAWACVFYGVRLGSYLLLREATRRGPSATIENGPLSGRLVFSVSLAIFYAFLVTPVLYAMRGTAAAHPLVGGGAAMAWTGAVLEAVADLQKFVAKQRRPSDGDDKDDDDKAFVGPTGGTYSISRHPNYLGEVLFWTGIFVGGIPSVYLGGFLPVAWVSSLLGWFGITSLMTMATKRLESRQAEKYGGQAKYDEWTKRVRSPLVPFFK